MGYDPTLGRWLEADPIGNPNTLGPGQSIITIFAELTAANKASQRFGFENADDTWLWQSVDGMNNYEFITGNPLNGTDPSGMDRYISNGNIARGQFHQGVAVDTWGRDPNNPCQWVKTGVVTFEFSVDWSYGAWSILGAVLFPGRVVESTGLNLDEPYTWESTPDEDMEMRSRYSQKLWMAATVQAASLVPSLNITPATTAGSNVLPLSFRQ
jgi:hypothetical protein